MNSFSVFNNKKKAGLSIVMGLLGLIFAPYGVKAILGGITIDIPWSLVLPIFASMAFGWRYGAVAGLSGGALFPFLLWANNGWANLFTAIIFLCIYILSGLLYDKSYFKKIQKLPLRIFVIILASILLVDCYYIFLFNTALAFNPPFWIQDTIQKLPIEILYSFAIKDSINIFLLILVSESLLKLPFICRLFGLPTETMMHANNKIFVASILTSLFIWLLFAGLSFALLSNTHALNNEHNALALLVLLSSGIMVSRVLCYYSESQFIMQGELNISEKKYRELFEANKDGITIFFAYPDGKVSNFLEMNESAAAMLGYTKAELSGMNPSEIEIDATEEKTGQRYKDLQIKGFSNFETFLKHKDGSFVPVEITALLITYNKLPALMNIVRGIKERRQAEEALRQSENRFMVLFDDAPDAMLLADPETGKIIDANNKACKLFKKQKHELVGLLQYELHPPLREDYSKMTFKAQYEKTRQILNVEPAENEICCSDGTEIPVEILGQTINLDGKSLMLGTFRDITERKLSEAIFKDIIEKNPISIQILDMEGYPIQVNPAHTNLFGVKPPADYSVLKDPQLLSVGFDEFFGRIKKGEVVYFPDSYYNVHDVDPSFPDSPIWVKALGFTLNDNDGKPYRIVLMHENMTERRKAEALLNDIIEKNPLSIQIVDKDGHILLGNPAFIRLFGSFPPPDFSIFDDLKSKSAELANLISRVKNGDIVHLPDTYFNAHDVVAEAPDIPLWIRALIFPLNDSGGKPDRFVFMHENITDRKIAEQELIKARDKAEESDRLKSAFLANMSHEIRTPMNGILGFADLLKEPNLSGAEQQKYIEIIGKSGNRMLNIINDIIDISKIEAGLMKPDIQESNINEQIEYIYTFFKPEVEAKGIKFSFKTPLPSKEATILTDREKVYAILTNLVKNAIKYTHKGEIEFGYDPVGTRVGTRHGVSIQCFVKDTGIGIPPNRQEAIFGRFVQADIEDTMARQGAGLGLAISKSYVEMLGGKIWVESSEGVGSSFYFTVPYHIQPEKTSVIQQPDVSAKTDAVKTLKILIADDDEASEMLISINLNVFSKEILKVRTGVEAIEACRNNSDIDLVLMDIRMPETGGYEATRQIREFNKEVVIIAQTAYGLAGDREKAIEAGCNDYISKPIKKNELLGLIQKYFGK